MNEESPSYDLVEALEYSDQIKKLSDNQPHILAAISGATWSLRLTPRIWPRLDGLRQIRILKTEALGQAPALSIWFIIHEGEKQIELLYLEERRENGAPSAGGT